MPVVTHAYAREGGGNQPLGDGVAGVRAVACAGSFEKRERPMHGFASGVRANAFFILSGAVFSVSFGSRSSFVMQRSKRCEVSGSIAPQAFPPRQRTRRLWRTTIVSRSKATRRHRSSPSCLYPHEFFIAGCRAARAILSAARCSAVTAAAMASDRGWMSTTDFTQERSVRIAASSIAVATTLSIGALLFRPVALPSTASAMDVVLIDRIVRIDPVPAASAPVARPPDTAPSTGKPPNPRTEPARAPEDMTRSAPPSAAVVVPPPESNPAVAAAPPNRWLLPDRFSMRPRNAPADPALAPKPRAPGDPSERSQYYAKKLLERRNPLGDQPPPLHDWFGDAGKKAAREDGQVSVNRVAEAIFGKDIQSAKARPPPSVRFRPELHERPSDLGSEATGDAYKAAAVAYEAVPGLEGEASRRIREAIELLLKLPTGCERQTVEGWLAPARKHLAELERAEYAYGHGADPMRREHMLPRAADTAYDQARRAIAYAEGRLAGCGK
ncbi:hypothetical protein [Lysobacter sp. 22409]|uniref:hypothetical protein n=1 Tax=Lysobacter sp. 22409 TaxID=3453917 RepID=UPI003F875E6F